MGTGWPRAPRACGRLSSIDFRARFPPRRRRVRHRRRSCGPIEFSSPRRQALNIHTLESLLPCTRPPVVACPPCANLYVHSRRVIVEPSLRQLNLNWCAGRARDRRRGAWRRIERPARTLSLDILLTAIYASYRGWMGQRVVNRRGDYRVSQLTTGFAINRPANCWFFGGELASVVRDCCKYWSELCTKAQIEWITRWVTQREV